MDNQTFTLSDSLGASGPDEASFNDGKALTLIYNAEQFTTVVLKSGTQSVTFTINGNVGANGAWS